MQQINEIDPFRELTWGDLTAWTGKAAVDLGRTYQKNGSVDQLSRMGGYGLIAWVRSGEDFVTRVEIDGGDIIGECTCQEEDSCAHMVAVILDYIVHIKRKIELPIARENDPRIFLL